MPHVDYYYDLTGTYAYVLLNGPDERVQKVIQFLQGHDIRVTGHGKSNYPARSGRQYDWYVRVTTDGGAKPEIKTVHSLLKTFQTDDHLAVEQRPDQAHALQTMLQAQKHKLDEALAHLLRREQELERTRRENEDLAARQAQTKDHADGAQRQAESLAVRVRQLEEAYAQAKEDLQKQVNFVSGFVSDFDALREENKNLNNEISIERAKADKLKEALSEAREALEAPGTGEVTDKRAFSSERMMKDVLEAIYPEVELLRDSVDTLITLDDNKYALQRIRQIVTKSDNLGRIDKLKNSDFWEVYYSTGQDESGRLYFRPVDGSGYQVLVSLKEKQNKDTQYLKKQ
jgi:hypothetical protein